MVPKKRAKKKTTVVASPPVARIGPSIYLVRGERVILDEDLARLYGTTTGRLNEQVKRNQDRFPRDFAFVLSPQEVGVDERGLPVLSPSTGR